MTPKFKVGDRVVAYGVVGTVREARESYVVDWPGRAEVCEAVQLQPAPPERTYRIGQRFRHQYGDDLFILACVDVHKVILIQLNNGCRYNDAFPVKDVYAITEAEFVYRKSFVEVNDDN